MICPNCDAELDENGECQVCGYGMMEADGELCLAPKHAKSCPSCGLECDRAAKACPSCGYSFQPKPNGQTPSVGTAASKNPYITSGTVLMARVMLVVWLGLSVLSFVGSFLSF